MKLAQPGTVAARAIRGAAGSPIRLDLLGNPYGPSLHVFDALGGCDELYLPAEVRAVSLQRRLAETLGVPPSWLFLANGLEELVGLILLWRQERGPIVLGPPSTGAYGRIARAHRCDVVMVRRGPSFGLELDVETAAELPTSSTALIDSPNDPTGNVLGSQETVRLARACDLVVIDERHGEYTGRTLLPLVREFDNLLILRSFETWAGLAGLPLAFAVGPPKLIAELSSVCSGDGPAMGAVVAAAATLDDLAYVRATVSRVREERSRLYRMLRKLNMLRPFPSLANFVAARVERGGADRISRELADRDILVHRPIDCGLEHFIRVSATRPEQTDALKRALVEIAAGL